jgi:hypothetical protein
MPKKILVECFGLDFWGPLGYENCKRFAAIRPFLDDDDFEQLFYGFL